MIKYQIENISEVDFVEIAMMNRNEFTWESRLSKWLDDLDRVNISTTESIKIVNEKNKIIGYLLVADCTMNELTKGMFNKCPQIQPKFAYKCFYCLNILEPYRGQGLSKIMIEYVMKRVLLKTQYIFLAVAKQLVTHSLWKKYGAIEVGSDECNIFYVLSNKEDIISKVLNFKNKKQHNINY